MVVQKKKVRKALPVVKKKFKKIQRAKDGQPGSPASQGQLA
jgi:hypothetical protein